MQSRIQARYRMLDCWRGFACLSVVAYHATWCLERPPDGILAHLYNGLRLGYLGVPVFFVVSGYCIAAAADAHRLSHLPGRVFILRRIRRIYPPFWIVTGCLALLFIICQQAGCSAFHQRYATLIELSPLHWIGNITLSETWLRHTVGDRAQFVHAVAWSLCYEEQFYFICFILLLCQREHLFRSLAIVTIGVTIIWIAVCAAGGQGSISGTFVDFGWWQFACGVLVYWRLNYVRDRLTAIRIDRLVFGTGTALIALSLWLGRKPDPASFFFNPWLALGTATMTAMALIRLRPFDEQVVRSYPGAMLAWVGSFSYSLYLTHIVTCRLVPVAMSRLAFWSPDRMLVGIIPMSVFSSVLLGWAVYHVVEKRFLNKPLQPARQSQPECAHSTASDRLPVPAGLHTIA